MADIDEILNKYAPIASSSGDSPARSQPMSLLEDDVAAPVFLDADVTASTAAGRGLVQGLTAGFGDELVALATMDPHNRDVLGSYRSRRDAERAVNTRAKEQQGGAYLAGEIGGGLISSAIGPGRLAAGVGVKALSGAARVGMGAARGAGAGAVYGLGQSEADTLGGMAADVGSGALGGAVLGGALPAAGIAGRAVGRGAKKATGAVGGKVGKAFSAEAAAERNATRLTRDAAEGAKSNLFDNIAQDKDRFARVLTEEGITPKLARDPRAFSDAIAPKLREAGKDIGDVIEALDAGTNGTEARQVLQALNGLRSKYAANPGTRTQERAIAKVMKAVKEDFGSGRDKVTFRQLQRFRTGLGKGTFSNKVDPSVQAELKQEIYGAVSDLMKSRVDEVAQLGSSVGSSAIGSRPAFAALAKAGEAAKRFDKLNERYSVLKSASDAAGQRVVKSNRDAISRADKSSILKDIASGVERSGLTGGAMAAVRKVWDRGLEKLDDVVMSRVDSSLARRATGAQPAQTVSALAKWAAENPDMVSRVELARRAAAMGLSGTMANRIAELIAQRQGN